ncbi:MAG: molybdopterin molybdenumtransferase MoeA, partial [Brachybacterium sp.]|nr:molybdopterin molybdenumtransferase MoeA [Brachybacterium sp.]
MSAIRPDPQQWRDLLLREIVLPSLVDQVPTEQARGRELAAAVRSPEAMPAVPIAAMDGFAVRRTDLVAPGRTTLPVSAELPARPGEIPALAAGTAARIMTGAAVPRGADAVIEVEASDADPFGPVPAAVTF